MSSGRGKGGRTGIAGNVNVALEKSDGTNTPLPADDEGLLIAKLFGEDNNGNDNAISTDSKGRLTVKQSSALRNVEELQNETGVTTGTDTGGGSLPSNAVPDGKAVSVKAQFGNAGAVQINGDYPLLEGDSVSLQVQNTDQISYTTDNGTESVAFIVEG